jgi:hypothetical protein
MQIRGVTGANGTVADAPRTASHAPDVYIGDGRGMVREATGAAAKLDVRLLCDYAVFTR